MKTKFIIRKIFLFNFVLAAFVLFNGCTPVKNVVYFQNLQKDTILHNIINNDFELKIRKNDLLSISIVSPDPLYTPLFNGLQSGSSSTSGGSNTGSATAGFLVDNEGNITMYKLGVIHVEGLTRSELKYRLEKDLGDYLKDAVVSIRYLNNHVTMIGEVSKPQVLYMPNEALSLLDAIGQSGDLTITGRRDNVLVIRETPAGKQFKRLNLTDNSIFYSPFYYLKPDDVVYVEPTKVKLKNTAQTQQTVSYVLTAFSILITLFSLLRK